MQLHLVLVALVQQALCSHQVLDAAEIHKALQTKPLDTWIESIATKRQISKDAVRANVRGVKYYLEPEKPSQDPGNATAGGEHAQLERRQVPEDYPDVYQSEEENDLVTNGRLFEYHSLCRERFAQPDRSPYVPNHNVRSFWRAVYGGCRGLRIRILCRLPTHYGPRGWNETHPANKRETSMTCAPGKSCQLFEAHNYPIPPAKVKWGGCVERKETPKVGVVNNVPNFAETLPCPIMESSSSNWEVYGYTADKLNADWSIYSGVWRDPIHFSRSPNFLFSDKVEWRGKDPDYRPWMKFGRSGSLVLACGIYTPVMVNLYSHVCEILRVERKGNGKNRVTS